jgi:hypothetical protein
VLHKLSPTGWLAGETVTEDREILVELGCLPHEAEHGACVEDELRPSLGTDVSSRVIHQHLHERALLDEIAIVQPAIASPMLDHVIRDDGRYSDWDVHVHAELLQGHLGILKQRAQTFDPPSHL